MARKKYEREDRHKNKTRYSKGEYIQNAHSSKRLLHSDDCDEETGNETIVEYSSDEYSHNHKSSYRTSSNRYQTDKRDDITCFSCTRSRSRCWHETLRDIAIITTLLMMICATIKDSQILQLVSIYNQLSNITQVVLSNTNLIELSN